MVVSSDVISSCGGVTTPLNCGFEIEIWNCSSGSTRFERWVRLPAPCENPSSSNVFSSILSVGVVFPTPVLPSPFQVMVVPSNSKLPAAPAAGVAVPRLARLKASTASWTATTNGSVSFSD